MNLITDENAKKQGTGHYKDVDEIEYGAFFVLSDRIATVERLFCLDSVFLTDYSFF